MSPPVGPKPHRFLFDTPHVVHDQDPEQSPFTKTTHRRPAFAASPVSVTPTAFASVITTPAVNRRKQFVPTSPTFLTSTATQSSQSIGKTHGKTHGRHLIDSVIQDDQHDPQPDLLHDTIDEASQSTFNGIEQADQAREPEDQNTTLFDSFEDEVYIASDSPDSPAAKRIRLLGVAAPSPISPERKSTTSPSAALTARRFFKLNFELPEEPEDLDAVVVSKRQAFIRSSSPVDGRLDIDPLPIQFSPHRKGQKFEPGGLAAVMRSQIMDLTALKSIQHNRKSDRWTFEILTVEAAIPFVLVDGTMADNIVQRFILAGPSLRSSPKPGDTIQVQGINWIVDLDEHRWTVCIEWKILK